MDNYKILNFHPIFAENAFCLSQRLGIEIITDFIPKEGYTYLVFGAHEQSHQLLTIQIRQRNFNYIIMNSEPPLSQFLKNKYYISLMRSNVVFDYHKVSAEHLTTLGIRVLNQFIFEFVYSPGLIERDIDIMFIGSRTPRREAIYQSLKTRYPDKRIIFHFEWGLTDQVELTKELQRAKVLLNIPYHTHNILESHRINKGLASGCQVVSLYSGHKETDDLYSKCVHFTHDFFEWIDTDDMLPEHFTEKKQKYPALIGELNKYTSQLKWILEQMNTVNV